MKTETCYFCNSILNNVNCCQTCRDAYGLDYVYTTYISDKNNNDLMTYYSEIGVTINKIQYSIDYQFLDCETFIPINKIETGIYGGSKFILMLPGRPFTPANIKEKLKLYLIFS
jgi:hypothetical protein